MGIRLDGLSRPLQTLGTAYPGPFCVPSQCQVCPILFQGGHGHCLPGRRLPPTMVRGIDVPVPSDAAASPDSNQDNAVRYRRNPHCHLVAEATVVRSPIRNSTRSLSSTSDTIPSVTGQRGFPPSQCSVPSPDGLEDNPCLREGLDHARKPSTMCLYQGKWKAFTKFAQFKGMTTVPASLRTVLTFLLHLFSMGLACQNEH